MSRSPIRVSVGGGKGGVGKSLVSVNLAASLAALGLRTVLVDGDLGSPNLHTLLGVSQVGPTLQALLDRRITRIEEALVATPIPRLSLVAGTSGLPGSANPSHQEKLKLLRHVATLDADIVVVDVGAGTAFNTLDLFTCADVRLVVATSELTSLQNAYCFLKSAALREIATLAKSEGALDAWTASFDRGETSRMSTWLQRLEQTRPMLVARMRAQLATFGARWVGNRVSSPADRHAVFALARLTKEFLGIDAPVLATLPSARALAESVQQRRPAVVGPGADSALVGVFALLAEHVATFERPVRPERVVEDELVTPPPEEPDDFGAKLGAHTRRESRIDVHFPTRVRLPSGEHAGVVVDLSPGGARVLSSGRALPGDRVRIQVPRGAGHVTLDGTVRHAASGSFGVALDPGSDAGVRTLLAGESSAPGVTA